jgi:hypothetical protein
MMSAHQTWFWPLDGQPAQEIRVYLVPGRWLRRPRLRDERRNAHLAHQPPNTLAIDGMARSSAVSAALLTGKNTGN